MSHRKAIHRWTRVATIVVALALAAPLPASAYSTAPGYVAHDYATGFLSSQRSGWGPIGVAFDQSDDLYVTDTVDGNLYRFAPGGGHASTATLIGNIGQRASALVVTADGLLYAARLGSNDVVQVDTVSGRVLRTVASGIQCPTGLAVDPVTGDLFVSQNMCGTTIFRISNYSSGPGTVTPYASLANADGLAFNADGTLYAESAGAIYSIGGTASSRPGLATAVANVPNSDGLAFGATLPGGRLPFLVSNRIDGVVTRVDFAGPQPSAIDIFSGGTRGDFAAVDSHGCLYITQSDRIVKIAPTDRACGLVPTTPGSPTQVASQLALQCTRRRLILIDVLQRGNRVELLGAADRSLIGRQVDIIFRAGGTRVATPVIGGDGFFHATAPLPPARFRNTNLARYQARVGAERSLDLKLSRRMIVKSISSRNRVVTIAGRVTRPLAQPIAPITVQRRVSCSRYVTVTRVKPHRDGTFTATLAGPPRDQAAVYRAATFVRKHTASRKLFPTFTLPRVVALD
jgi:DNA-binding beta-propeller fold protein YncE